MRTLGILFYTTVLTLIGGTLIFFALERVPPSDIVYLLAYAQGSLTSRLLVGLSGLLLILISVSFAQTILGKFQKEKTIAFTTASGVVTIALTAVEDLIRRLTGVISEIKELKPNVRATKKGIIVDLRVILKSEANIPDLTSRLQDITRARIQEVLGVEEQIIIKIHVAKIAPLEQSKDKRHRGDAQEPVVPYGGYRA